MSPFFMRKRCVFKRLDHCAAGKEVQVAAAGRRARVLRVLLGEVGKCVRGFADLRQQLLALARAFSRSAAGALAGAVIRMWLARRSSLPDRRAAFWS
jgi:hypothetical protein